MSGRRLHLRGKTIRVEPDQGPRDTQFHKRIVSVQPIPRTGVGYWCDLECGHVVQILGKLDHLNGVALCTKCCDRGAKA
jgi:hypothetical protein